MKNNRFSSNKTKKFIKIVNRKQSNKPGTIGGVRAHAPKNHEKTLKIELFTSFVWNLS
jgi:hypothetical protein